MMVDVRKSPSGRHIEVNEGNGNYGLPYSTRFASTSPVTTSLTQVGGQFLTVPSTEGTQVKRIFTASLSISNGTGVTDLLLQSSENTTTGPWITVGAVNTTKVSGVESVTIVSAETVTSAPALTYYRLASQATETGSQIITQTAGGNTSEVVMTCIEFDY